MRKNDQFDFRNRKYKKLEDKSLLYLDTKFNRKMAEIGAINLNQTFIKYIDSFRMCGHVNNNSAYNNSTVYFARLCVVKS